MKQIVMNGFKRIDKKEALKIFLSGKELYLAPSKSAPSITNIDKIRRNSTDVNYAKAEFELNIDNVRKRVCDNLHGKELYYYKKLDNTAVHYKLSADFGDRVRIHNINTGKTVDVEKSKVIERMQLGMVEVQGYEVSPDGKNLISYR